MKVEVLYLEGCPNHVPTAALVREALTEERVQAEVQEIEVRTREQAETLGFLGSPSVRVNGLDIEVAARGSKSFGLGCRTYVVGGRRSGTPSGATVREAIRAGREASGGTASVVGSGASEPAVLVAGGVAALLASSCCLGPLVLLGLGFSGAWIGSLTRLEPYRPFFLGAALVALLLASRRIFRPAVACRPGEVCAVPQVRRGYKVLFGVTAALMAVALLFPYVARYFY